MNIGELSKKSGIPTKTIRFYEQIGLAPEPKRTNNGYRTYGENDLDDLRIIKYTRDLGLPINEIKKLMLGCKNGNCSHSKEYLSEEIENYLQILEEKENQMKKLKARLTLLKKSLINGRLGKSKYCCNILGQISEMDEGGDEK